MGPRLIGCQPLVSFVQPSGQNDSKLQSALQERTASTSNLMFIDMCLDDVYQKQLCRFNFLHLWLPCDIPHTRCEQYCRSFKVALQYLATSSFWPREVYLHVRDRSNTSAIVAKVIARYLEVWRAERVTSPVLHRCKG